MIALFEDLPDADLERIAAGCSIRTYDRNVQILGEHDQTNDVFFILRGAVRINSHSPAGREIIFSDFGTGGMFGEFSAIDGLPRSATVVALSDCLLARMSASNFFNVLRSNGGVSTRLVELLVSKIRKMSERVFEVSALAVKERVRRELLRLAAEGVASRQGIIIEPAPTHYEIAARIGSHREAVTRVFNRLEAEKIIEVGRRQIRIVDIARLEEMEEI